MEKTAVNPMLVLAVPVWRQRLMAGLLLTLLAALVVRAAYLQGVQRDFLQQQGEARYERQIEVPAMRGRVLDRNGQILADSSPVASIWADPAKVREWSTEDFARLAHALGMSTDELDRRLGQGGRRFVYLRRQLPPDQAAPLAQLGLEGVGVVEEYQRFYPQGEAFAQLVGLVDVDGNGIEGLEASLQAMLQGEAGKRLVIQDRRGRVVQDSVWVQRPRDGRDVVLSLDARIQHITYRALERAVELHQARAGGAVVIDVRTGEILALANWPSYNPNRRHGARLERGAQPRGHRHLRARLGDEARAGCLGTGARQGQTGHAHRHPGGRLPGRQPHDPGFAYRRSCPDGIPGDPEVVQRGSGQDRARPRFEGSLATLPGFRFRRASRSASARGGIGAHAAFRLSQAHRGGDHGLWSWHLHFPAAAGACLSGDRQQTGWMLPCR